MTAIVAVKFKNRRMLMKGECAMSLVLEFVSCVVKNLVNVPEDVMDGWVQNPKALQKALTDALCPSVHNPTRRWQEENGVIYFEVTSDGTTGPGWIDRLKKKGFQLSKRAKDVLNSPDFKPTNGVTYRIAVLKGTLFADGNRTAREIRVEAERHKLAKPNAEVACLIRELFSNKELEAMGLWWIAVFHKPIKDSDGDPDLLVAGRGDGGRWLDVRFGRPDGHWYSGNGFAFAVSQVSSS